MDPRTDWPIDEIARLAGISSRTLRHYGDVGLLTPTRTGPGGRRFYDATALATLQRILVLRQFGVGIPSIRASLADRDDAAVLAEHLVWLRRERDRLDRQIRAVEHTVRARQEGAAMDAAQALDGFDQGSYEQEVTERWGAETWERSVTWWSELGPEGQRSHAEEHIALAEAYAAARLAGVPPEADPVQALVARHHRWVAAAWGREPDPEAFLGLADAYVADDRFAASYGGAQAAAYVRDAIAAFATVHVRPSTARESGRR